MNRTRTILIFGATSAIAAETANEYARRGDKLYLIGRNRRKLATLCERLGDAVVDSKTADFNTLHTSQALVEKAFQTIEAFDIVLIAHGQLGDQRKSKMDSKHAADIIHTNFLSVVALLVPLVQRLKLQDSAVIGVITSVAGERGRPRNFTYGAAKGGLSLYLQGLRSTLYRTGVRIVNLKLGPVDTPMTASHKKNSLFITPKQAAHKIVLALDRSRHTVYIPNYWGPIMATVRVLPERVFQWFPFLSGRD